MILKFNNGRGALICEQCRIIVMSDFLDIEWEALNILNDQAYEWFCSKCCETCQQDQDQKFINIVNEIDLNTQRIASNT